MDKIEGKSISASLIKYLLPCMLICMAGCYAIDIIMEYLYNWYAASRFNNSGYYELKITDERHYTLLCIISAGKYILIPLWSALCLWSTFRIFYRRELEAPIKELQAASDRILSDDLDFKVESSCTNELGQLCVSFEEMRKNLYESNYELWKSLEERKRLNSAFSHDLRTPITVLKGCADLVSQFSGRLSQEKQAEILQKMSSQISRLEHYTEKMNSVQKLEDIIPDENTVLLSEIMCQLRETGKLLCGDTDLVFEAENVPDVTLYTDQELIMQVFENLVSNALRYTASCVSVKAELLEGRFSITVSDNGKGFSDEALRKAWQPFYRDDKEENKEHFGLGLYICRLLCMKCGGQLTVKNGSDGGGMVTAEFSVKKCESR
ncbi:MAG: HAMP domain-containing histidine kinase [Ruminococcus sp.]|nr:HAMP domain-containing histidine kinase [Ruminococcus sp.]